MNPDGFREHKRGDTISLEVDEANEAIAEGAELALPHASPGVPLDGVVELVELVDDEEPA